MSLTAMHKTIAAAVGIALLGWAGAEFVAGFVTTAMAEKQHKSIQQQISRQSVLLDEVYDNRIEGLVDKRARELSKPKPDREYLRYLDKDIDRAKAMKADK